MSKIKAALNTNVARKCHRLSQCLFYVFVRTRAVCASLLMIAVFFAMPHFIMAQDSPELAEVTVDWIRNSANDSWKRLKESTSAVDLEIHDGNSSIHIKITENGDFQLVKVVNSTLERAWCVRGNNSYRVERKPGQSWILSYVADNSSDTRRKLREIGTFWASVGHEIYMHPVEEVVSDERFEIKSMGRESLAGVDAVWIDFNYTPRAGDPVGLGTLKRGKVWLDPGHQWSIVKADLFAVPATLEEELHIVYEMAWDADKSGMPVLKALSRAIYDSKGEGKRVEWGVDKHSYQAPSREEFSLKQFDIPEPRKNGGYATIIIVNVVLISAAVALFAMKRKRNADAGN